jgi:hypothetical protein
MNTQTNLSNQNYSDIKKIVNKNDLTNDEKIEIYVQFGSSLTKQNFQEIEEYYTFLNEFKKQRYLK